MGDVNESPIAVDDNEIDSGMLITLDSAPLQGVVEIKDFAGSWVTMIVGSPYSADSEIKYVPDAGYPGNLEPVVLTTTYADGTQISKSFSLAAGNSGEVFLESNLISTDEDTAVTIDVLSNDSDPEGDSLFITHVQGHDFVTDGNVATIVNGSGETVGTAIIVSVDGKPQIQFTPDVSLQSLDDGEEVTVNFSYEISDGQGGTATADVSVVVHGDNDAPELITPTQPLNYTTDEDTPLIINESDILAKFTDADGDVLSIASLSVDIGDIVDNNDGTWTFTPSVNSDNDPKLTIKVTDGKDVTLTQTNIVVDAVADAPQLNVTTETVELQSITTANVNSQDSGFVVTAIDASGNPAGISINASPVGFGVVGQASGANTELGFSNANNASESLIISFDNNISAVDVSFSWKHSSEHATYTFYKNGQQVGISQTHIGGTDRVDDADTLKPSNNGDFDQIVFTAPGANHDYLINTISYQKPTVTDVDTNNSINVDEKSYVSLNIDASLVDVDRSESLKVEVKDIPVGFTLTDGNNLFTATSLVTNIDVSNWNLSNLSLQTVEVKTDTAYTLNVVATSTESSNGNSAESSLPITVNVKNVPAISGYEDTDIPLTLTEVNNKAVIENVPEGYIVKIDGQQVSAPVNGANSGKWVITNSNIDKVSITPPENSDESFTITVNGEELDIAVIAIADTPSLEASLDVATITNNSILEANLEIQSLLNDNDGSESLSIAISGIPSGAQLSQGTLLDGTWILTPAQLKGLKISTLADPISQPVPFDIQITATSTENANGDTASKTFSIYGIDLSSDNRGGYAVDTVTVSGDKLSESNSGSYYFDDNGDRQLQAGFNNANTPTASNAQTIFTYGSNDRVESGDGNDIIYAGATGKSDNAEAGDTDDELQARLLADSAENQIENLNFMVADDASMVGDDTFLNTNIKQGTSDFDIVNAFTGDDIIYGESGNDLLYGHDGEDKIFGGSHNDGLRGGKGSDLLDGGSGDDVVRGDAGDDTIIGGSGNDLLIGDGGADTFVWLDGEVGTDHIQDFNQLVGDKLDLSDLLHLTDGDNLDNFLDFESNNGDTTIDVMAEGDGVVTQTIILDGVDLGSDDVTIINDLLSKDNGDSALFIGDNVSVDSTTMEISIDENI
ncbi:hypothetical protein CW745_14350 [Psychromonas sp. psych-6C06]|nr:hypothetical protein CW745_14350 [Psychromonas sp. psych-6C06]